MARQTNQTKNNNGQIFKKMDIDVLEIEKLIKKAYEIAQEKNHIFTYEEAKRYDPLISTLFEAVQKFEGLK